jgi:hypothetical protein
MTTTELAKVLSEFLGKTVYLFEITDRVRKIKGDLDIDFIEWEYTWGNEYRFKQVDRDSDLYSKQCTVKYISNRFTDGDICDDMVFVAIDFTGEDFEW